MVWANLLFIKGKLPEQFSARLQTKREINMLLSVALPTDSELEKALEELPIYWKSVQGLSHRVSIMKRWNAKSGKRKGTCMYFQPVPALKMCLKEIFMMYPEEDILFTDMPRQCFWGYDNATMFQKL